MHLLSACVFTYALVWLLYHTGISTHLDCSIRVIEPFNTVKSVFNIIMPNFPFHLSCNCLLTPIKGVNAVAIGLYVIILDAVYASLTIYSPLCTIDSTNKLKSLICNFSLNECIDMHMPQSLS